MAMSQTCKQSESENQQSRFCTLNTGMTGGGESTNYQEKDRAGKRSSADLD